MSKSKTELEKRNVVRLSNKQANMMTKACMQSALQELLEVKSINDISVSELTRKAGVSRTAFYSNYQTINDVLYECIDSYLTTLNRYIWDAIRKKEDVFEPVIRHIHDEFDSYSLVLNGDLERTAFLHVRDYLNNEYPSIDDETRYLIIGTIGLLRNVIIEWSDGGCQESVEFIAKICNETTKVFRERIIERLQNYM